MTAVVVAAANTDSVPGPVLRTLCGSPHFTLSKTLGKISGKLSSGSQSVLPGPAASASPGNAVTNASCYKCKFSGPTTALLNQKLWAWAQKSLF